MKEEYQLVEEGCKFWFNDNEHVRTPFPKEIQKDLKKKAQQLYLDYIKNLTPEDRQEITDDELVSVFEMFLFSESITLIDEEDKDLLLSIHYPFLPRTGDVVNDKEKGECTIIARNVTEKEVNDQKEKKLYMRVELKTKKGEKWETEFEVPA
ncbi:MAG: hypothetical protein H8E84_01705 [Flavobacteriales bacterium]|nr:hypothetical protein [Flavobacteriales bacterium]